VECLLVYDVYGVGFVASGVVATRIATFARQKHGAPSRQQQQRHNSLLPSPIFATHTILFKSIVFSTLLSL
jgi:hypothetical protein